MHKPLVIAAFIALALSGCAAAPASEIAQPVAEVVAVNPPIEQMAQEVELAQTPPASDKRTTEQLRALYIKSMRDWVPALTKKSDAELFALADLACAQHAAGTALENIDNIPRDGTPEYPAGHSDRYIASGALLWICY